MDSLLVVCGRKIAELGDGGGDDAQGKLNIRGSGVAAEAEAQTGAGLCRRQTNGGEDVRRLDGAGGTGGSGRTGETFQVQRNEEGFALDAGKNQVRSVGGSWSGAAVYKRLGNVVQQTLLQFVAKSGLAPRVIRERLAGDFRGLAESHDAGNVFRAA